MKHSKIEIAERINHIDNVANKANVVQKNRLKFGRKVESVMQITNIRLKNTESSN